ncbi:MAG: thioredoxin family protein [Ignavibacteriae bacterium]|nr:thioredoxin family protein [Ignavibacteriota bacterium]
MKFKYLFLVIVLIFLSQTLQSESKDVKHVRFTAQPSKIEVKNGEKFSVLLTMKLDKYWHTYSLKEQLGKEGIGPNKTEITVGPKEMASIIGKIKTPKPKVEYDKGFEINLEMYYGKVEFEIVLKAKKDLNFNKDKAYINIYIELCDTTSCLPSEDYKTFIGNKVYNPSVGLIETTDTSEFAANSNDTTLTQTVTADKKSIKKVDETESQKEIDTKKSEGILSFLWFAMSAGAFALLTPCVFPMVPITVSFFTKRAEKKKGKGLRDSFVYALGIITTFTALGFLLALIFGATGIQDFATNPFINIFIAGIFIVFAFNLFGAFEIQLPTGLMNKLNMKSQGSGITSVLLMGLTFSLTSFTCTVPFVGSALISASGGEWFYPIIGMLGFSTVFAAPFFLLALFPTAMQTLPKAGGWMNNVKVVMGFLEIAAAIKFISNVDLVWGLGIMPRDLFISIWIACGLLITIYVLGIFRLSHDSPVDSVKSLRILFALFFSAVTFYLMSGLFGKPLGELDAFLPPPDYQQIIGNNQNTNESKIYSVVQKGDKLTEDVWLSDYKFALAEAKRLNKPLFIDFTGFTCTNCRWMEINMFAKPGVRSLIDKFVKVRLFTDRRGEPYATNKRFQKERFNSIELPLYVIMTGDEKLIGTKAFTRDENEFVKFMKKALN